MYIHTQTKLIPFALEFKLQDIVNKSVPIRTYWASVTVFVASLNTLVYQAQSEIHAD